MSVTIKPYPHVSNIIFALEQPKTVVGVKFETNHIF